MTTTLPHLTGDAASHYIEGITVLEVILGSPKVLIRGEGKFDFIEIDVPYRQLASISVEIFNRRSSAVSYFTVEEARRIVDAINAAIAYVESSKGGAQ